MIRLNCKVPKWILISMLVTYQHETARLMLSFWSPGQIRRLCSCLCVCQSIKLVHFWYNFVFKGNLGVMFYSVEAECWGARWLKVWLKPDHGIVNTLALNWPLTFILSTFICNEKHNYYSTLLAAVSLRALYYTEKCEAFLIFSRCVFVNTPLF